MHRRSLVAGHLKRPTTHSFTGSVDPASGGVMMAIYCGYMLVLAIVAYAVVRFGKVWEDARTVLLIIVLLLAALSNSLDGFVLSNPELGRVYLAGGFLFALLLTEAVIAALGMRLPARYRIPFYLQLLLMFAYPAILSQLLVNEHKTAMRLCVLLFPALAGLTLLSLIPAAQRKPTDEPENGTPWRWPLYPWPLFVITTVAFFVSLVKGGLAERIRQWIDRHKQLA